MTEAFEATFTGRVQAVSLREYTRRKAESLNIVGSIQNLKDGTVRVYAEGNKRNLERLIEFLHQGSPDARVENIAYTWVTPKGSCNTFSIIYS